MSVEGWEHKMLPTALLAWKWAFLLTVSKEVVQRDGHCSALQAGTSQQQKEASLSRSVARWWELSLNHIHTSLHGLKGFGPIMMAETVPCLPRHAPYLPSFPELYRQPNLQLHSYHLTQWGFVSEDSKCTKFITAISIFTLHEQTVLARSRKVHRIH